MRIVVAEDQQEEGKELARLLGSLGHEVTTVLDGHEAVRACTQHAAELAIVDLLLPGLNGFDVARRLRRLANAPRLVAISGLDNPAAEHVARSVGFSALLRKPYTIDDLRALLAPFAGGDQAKQQPGGV
jgi:CheY-like chemotaxis protein